MKITAQEEYGLRILIRIARCQKPEGISIPQISADEGLSSHYVGKLCRALRLGGFIKSSRGKIGGYTLARPASEVSVNEILKTLGGKLYSAEFCESHSGNADLCRHTSDCNVRPLWVLIQKTVDELLANYSLQDLIEGRTVPENLPATPQRNKTTAIILEPETTS